MPTKSLPSVSLATVNLITWSVVLLCSALMAFGLWELATSLFH
ncbi:hypothetical protein [Fibrella forsythiae]|nr:hypothetical protein [Fibrella forsythiae]